MGYKPGEKWISSDIRKAIAGAAITDRAIVYLSAEDTVQVNDLSFRRVAGIAMDAYASGDSVDYCVRGRMDFVAGGAISVGQALVPDGTTGRVRAAYEGEKGIIGYAVDAASSAGDKCKGEFDFIAAEDRDQIIYYNSAVTANISPTLGNEAGTYTFKLHVEETAGNAVTGGLNIGNADDGQQLAATLTVGASTAYLYLPADMADVQIALDEDDEIFIHAETAWNSASLKFKLILDRVY